MGFQRLATGVFSRKDVQSSSLESLPFLVQEVFPAAVEESQDRNTTADRLWWYIYWLDDQLKTVPGDVLSCMVDYDAAIDGGWSSRLTRVFIEVAKCAKSSERPSVHAVVEHLAALDLITSMSDRESSFRAHSLVFAILGWQTMLYRPALGTCPPQQFAVTDEQDGYRGQAFITLRQSQVSAKRPLHEFLIGFGVLLPPPNLCIAPNVEVKGSFEETVKVEPSSLNAFLLNGVAHIKIKWVDILSCHLEFDEKGNTLFLFRYPSFCLLSRPSEGVKKPTRSVIHAASIPVSSSGRWASEEDVTQTLDETLLSYRLLFGQQKQSRNFFRTLKPFAGLPRGSQDTMLDSLCGRKSLSSSISMIEKESYDLERDFPILRSRLAHLNRRLLESKPRSWKELWRDKRNSANWYTFWTVLIFGVVSLVLSFLQVLLVVIQLAIQK